MAHEPLATRPTKAQGNESRKIVVTGAARKACPDYTGDTIFLDSVRVIASKGKDQRGVAGCHRWMG